MVKKQNIKVQIYEMSISTFEVQYKYFEKIQSVLQNRYNYIKAISKTRS